MLRRAVTLAIGGFAVTLALAAAGSGQQSSAVVLQPGETVTIVATPQNLAKYGEGAAAIVAKQGLFQYAVNYGWGAAANYAKSRSELQANVNDVPPTPKVTARGDSYVRAITAMTPVQLIEAFGTDVRAAAALSSLSPKERQYIESIMTLTPAQLRATFGTK